MRLPLLVTGALLCASLLATPAAAAAGVAREDVLTSHADRRRTGWMSSETVLTPAMVAGGQFGKLWETPALDGYGQYPARLYASPLFVDGLKITSGAQAGKTFKTIIAASSTGFVYAISAERAGPVAPGTVLWKTQLAPPCVLSWDASAMGVLGTPIVEKTRRTLYVSSCSAEKGWQVYALSLASGKVLSGWPVSIADKALADPRINRNPHDGPSPEIKPQAWRFYIQRGALNLSPDDRYLYVTLGQARGWLAAIDTRRKKLASSFSVTPLPQDAVGGIWASTGVSIDAAGYVYAVSGASAVRQEPERLRNWSQSFLQFEPLTSAGLTLHGVYTPFNYCRTLARDIDLGSSGAALIPPRPGEKDTDQLFAIGGKQGNAYLVSRSGLTPPGTERRVCNDDSESDLSLLGPQPQPQFGRRGPLNVFGPYSDSDGMSDRAKNRATPAFFRDAGGQEFLFYAGTTKDPADTRIAIAPGLVRVRLTRPADAPPYLQVDKASDFVLQNPGPPIVSSNGGADGIVWVFDENARRSVPLVGPGAPEPVLYAVDARTLDILWKTKEGELSASGKYNSPTIAKGKVFIGTDRVVAFGMK